MMLLISLCHYLSSAEIHGPAAKTVVHALCPAMLSPAYAAVYEVQSIAAKTATACIVLCQLITGLCHCMWTAGVQGAAAEAVSACAVPRHLWA